MKKNELVTDLTNIVYRHTDALEKAAKTQADTDKQLVDSMQQIRDLAADHDLKATQLADLEVAAQVVLATRLWWSIFVKHPKGSLASFLIRLESTWLML